MGYLDRRDAQARQPDDLDRHAGEVELLFEGTRCVGVKALVDGQGDRSSAASEVILSSGAIHSPAHLLRAGIGPVGHLQRARHPGASPPCAGVGQRLMDHPVDLAVVLHAAAARA